MSEANGKPVCIITHCTRDRYSRGLCNSCYRSAALTIKAGKTTWDELERLSLSLPVARVRRRSGPFGKAFDIAKRGSSK